MKKIKLYMITKIFSLDGISRVILNIVSNLNLEKYDITILAGPPINKNLTKELINKGIKFYELPNKEKNKLNYYKALYKYLKNNKPDIAHIHGGSSLLIIEVLICYLCGIKSRISHCHSNTSSNNTLHKIFKPIFNHSITTKIACSQQAGNWLYTKNFLIINNAIDINKFKYNEKTRKKIRKELNINNSDIIIGHVGRFDSNKNQIYLLSILKELLKYSSKYKLLLVGEVTKNSNIIEEINKNNLSNNTIIHGECETPELLYNAMDIFVFPSINEGLGLATVEAQINGLPTLTSDTIPQKTKVTNNIKYLNIQTNNIQTWVNEILKLSNQIKHKKINLNSKKIQQFNINKITKKYEKIYMQEMKRR